MKEQVKGNALLLINKAQGDFCFEPDIDQESRWLQAFLLQASIIEGLLRESCASFNKKNKVSDISEPKGFRQAAREARVSNSISKTEFKNIETYISFRNKIVHTLLKKNSEENLAEEIKEHYIIGSGITAFLLK